jgi:hypothetical protein
MCSTQLLYGQRRQVGEEGLFLGRKTLRLNPEVITSDVGPFEAARDAGNLEDGVARYTSPFLDGFFLGAGGGQDLPQSAIRCRAP